MYKFTNWLYENRKVNVVILVIYYLAVVLPHKKFGAFLNDQVFVGITRDQYDLYVLIIGIIGLFIYGILFFRNTRKIEHKRTLWIYLLINTMIAALVIKLLFVINIEIIHFPQYALFAILLFPLTGNYNTTLIWTTIAGAFDEAYQYFYLAPSDTSYYDFNDVITNLIGAIFGLLLLSSFNVLNRKNFNLKRSSIWIGFGFIFLSIVVLHLSGLLSIYPNDDRLYHIVREMPPGFWSKVYPNVSQDHPLFDLTYHVVKPLEGLLFVLGLWIFFRGIAPVKNNL